MQKGSLQIVRGSFTRHRGRSLSVRERSAFVRRLGLLLVAHIPLTEALRLCVSGESRRALRTVVSKCIQVVESGGMFSDVFVHTKLFEPAAIRSIRRAETHGALGSTLIAIADELDTQAKFKQKILSLLIYPSIVLCAAVCICIGLLVFLFPKIIPLFRGMHRTLPLPTRIVLDISNILRHGWFWIIVTVAIVCVGLWHILRRTQVRMKCERALLRVPYVGSAIRVYYSARYARACATLLRHGVYVTHVLRIAGEETGSILYTRAGTRVSQRVSQGSSFADAFAEHPLLFPELFIHMMRTGEHSGSLPESFRFLADLYEVDTVDLTALVAAWAEPVLTLGVGAIVCFIAVSMVAPIYDMTQGVLQ